MTSPVSEDRVLAVIQAALESRGPLTPSQLKKRLGARGVDAALTEALRRGLVFEHPKQRSRRFWHQPWSPEHRILELCEAKPRTLNDFAKSLPKVPKSSLEEFIRKLVAAGRVVPIHRFSGLTLKRSSKFATPEVCNKIASKLIGDIGQYYGGFGVKLEASSQGSLPEPHVSHAGSLPTEPRASSAQNGGTAEDRVAAALRSIETRTGTMVMMRDLRPRAAMDKREFDQAVLALSRRQIVAIHQHDAPTLLTEQERNVLVTDQEGRYYAGISWSNS